MSKYTFWTGYYSYYHLFQIAHKADFIDPFVFHFYLQNLGQRFGTAGLEYVFVLMSEIFPGKLGLFEEVET